MTEQTEIPEYSQNIVHLPPGIYFGLPDDVYHSLPYLSASGIKKLNISPAKFWVSSWMNPKMEVYDSFALKLGKAYHKRILEGRDAFYDEYCLDFDETNYPGMLRTIADLQDALRDRGLKVSGANKKELIDRLIMADPSAQIYDHVFQDWQENERGDKMSLSKDIIESIEKSAKHIECNPEIAKCFTNGYPEVTVIWMIDDIQFKARMDYLKIKAIIDYKSYANFTNREPRKKIHTEIDYNGYYFQAIIYSWAVEAAKDMIKKGMVNGVVDKDFLKKLCETEKHDFFFVFQDKDESRLTHGFRFSDNHSLWNVGVSEIDKCIRDYKKYLQTYGTDMWVHITKIEDCDDYKFPFHSLD